MSQFFQKAKRLLINSFLPVIIGLFLVVAVIYAVWQEPIAVPPGDNVPAPLNVGPVSQFKEGWLTIGSTVVPSTTLDIQGIGGALGGLRTTGGVLLNTGGTNPGLIVQYGNVGIGTTSPDGKLEIAGDNVLITGTPWPDGSSISKLSIQGDGIGSILELKTTGSGGIWQIRSMSAGGLDFQNTVTGNRPFVMDSNVPDHTILLTDVGNILLNTAGGGTGTKVLYMGMGTAPASMANNQIGLWVADRDGIADKAALHIMTEGDTQHVFGDLVGIGTTSPNETLEVAGSGRVFIGDGGGTNRTGLLIDAVEAGNYVRLHSYDYGTNQSMDLVINPFDGGNVGIGTTDPQSTLQVVGNYIQFPTISEEPSNSDCDATSEYGRVIIGTGVDFEALYFCTRGGWHEVSGTIIIP